MKIKTSSYHDKEVKKLVKEHQQNQKLNSSELGNLYANYLVCFIVSLNITFKYER
ncbi:hypothetical protein ACFSTA_20155 [Ornithinibacillus salinisoli]|uniref:Uncharacterized protein n=1 Tax=Ornithinibacillus salinisoli TaxID=1848459 RepID=A0ABW4W623_9BACI